MDALATGPVATEMRRRLEALNPTRLELIDDTEKHHGHGGYNPSGESHFTLLIESPAFEGKSRVERQRMVNKALGDLVGDRVHALSMKVKAPGNKGGSMGKLRWGWALALLLAGCSSNNGPQQAHDESVTGEEPPSVSPTAAPGVAFRYFYTFELPDESISAVQEKHAARCEGLGVERCRITGLNYTVGPDDGVSATLTVKLAPDIARQFGKDATADVKASDGQLRSTEFTGEDTEPTTTEASRQQSDIKTRIADIEKQLASTSKDNERAQLQAQLDQLRSKLSNAQATIEGAKAQLASTPMTFNYYGRRGISGFRTNPIWEAGRLFVSSVVTMIDVVLRVLAILLPWLVLIGLIVLFARSAVGRRIGRFFAPKLGHPEENE